MKINSHLVSSISGNVVVISLLSGCVAYGGIGYPDERQYPGNRVEIPQGHMPPPGECRIWHPDRPAGHQPPPGNCRDLKRRVPPGAILVYG